MLLTDSLFPFGAYPRRTGFFPAADVTVSDNDTVITMDLPGFTADALDLEVVDGPLIVRGERARPALADGARWALSERAFGKFQRAIRLADGVDPDAITASMTDGVLSLIVPKPERLKPRAIQIGSGSERRELEQATA